MTIFMDSFQYTTADIARKWNQIQIGQGQAIGTDGPYSNRIIRLQSGSSLSVATSRVQKSIGSSATFSISFQFRRPSTFVDPNTYLLCELYDAGTAQLRLAFSGGEKPGIYRGTTLLAEIDYALERDLWYSFRWKATISDSCPANSNQLQVVGPNVNLTATVATSTATRVTANNFASEFMLVHAPFLGTHQTVSRFFDYSDVYVSNEEAVLLPNLRIHAIRPTANGATMDWTPSAGSAWEAVDDATPDNDATRISTSTDAHVALFAHAGLPTPAASVKAIQMSAWSKKDDAFDVALEPVYRIAGTNYPVGESSVGNAYAAVTSATGEDPAAAGPWTGAVVNAMEIGVRAKHT